MKRFFLIGLVLFLIPVGCAKKEEKKVVVLPPKIPIEEAVKPEPPVYQYTSSNQRDPFLPLVTEAKDADKAKARIDLSAIDVTSLHLSGIIWDAGESLAMLHDGNNFGYILKNGRLLAENEKLIKGISGSIKNNKTVVLTQERTTVVFDLKTGEKQTQVKGMQYSTAMKAAEATAQSDR